jgi:hypothetical protein
MPDGCEARFFPYVGRPLELEVSETKRLIGEPAITDDGVSLDIQVELASMRPRTDLSGRLEEPPSPGVGVDQHLRNEELRESFPGNVTGENRKENGV